MSDEKDVDELVAAFKALQAENDTLRERVTYWEGSSRAADQRILSLCATVAELTAALREANKR